jgi:hypothetical protein
MQKVRFKQAKAKKKRKEESRINFDKLCIYLPSIENQKHLINNYNIFNA